MTFKFFQYLTRLNCVETGQSILFIFWQKTVFEEMKPSRTTRIWCCNEVKFAISDQHNRCNKMNASSLVCGEEINECFNIKTLDNSRDYSVCSNIFYQIRSYHKTKEVRENHRAEQNNRTDESKRQLGNNTVLGKKIIEHSKQYRRPYKALSDREKKSEEIIYYV